MVVIDMHGHWLSKGLREWGFQLLSTRNASENDLPLDGIEEENETNLRHMDKRGIDIQILSSRPVSMLSHENPYINIPWSKVFNNVLSKAIERNPDRFRGFAALPQSDMDASGLRFRSSARDFLQLMKGFVHYLKRGWHYEWLSDVRIQPDCVSTDCGAAAHARGMQPKHRTCQRPSGRSAASQQ